jgi:hypothetical protein
MFPRSEHARLARRIGGVCFKWVDWEDSSGLPPMKAGAIEREVSRYNRRARSNCASACRARAGEQQPTGTPHFWPLYGAILYLRPRYAFHPVGGDKRRAVPFRERPWRQELALSTLQKKRSPSQLLDPVQGTYTPVPSREPGARPRARVHTGEKLQCKCGTLV